MGYVKELEKEYKSILEDDLQDSKKDRNYGHYSIYGRRVENISKG
jgi:hypothetical protein